MKETISVFPDTNLFLHFPPMGDIDWCTIAGARTVHLHVCITVVHELDVKKSDPRLSSRAERAIKEIREAEKSRSEIRGGVVLSVFNREIRAAEFPDSLSPDSADDRIVHLVRLYQSEHPGEDVAIATDDYGMELRAVAGAVSTIHVSSALRLPNPQDELTKKHKQVLRELYALKSRRPQLSLGLSTPGGKVAPAHELVFELTDSWRPIDIDGQMKEIRAKFPRLGDQGIAHHPALAAVQSHLSDVNRRYDNELDTFYSNYRKHLEFVNVVESAKSRSISFDLWLANDGGAMASDVDVAVALPDQVRVVAEKGTKDCEPLEKNFAPPRPPEKPALFDFGRPDPFALSRRPLHLEPGPMVPRDEWTPRATVHRGDGGKSEIRVQVGKLKHGHNVCLGKFVLVLASWEDARPFHADWVVTTSELPHQVIGRLPFIARLVAAGN